MAPIITYPYDLIVAPILAYIIGSIPSAFIITWLFTGRDVRKSGSGTVGGRNTFRFVSNFFAPVFLFKKKSDEEIAKIDRTQIGEHKIAAAFAFLIVFIIDFSKGILAMYLVGILTENGWAVVLAGVFAVVGHNYMLFLKFHGGKGVATSEGILAYINPLLAVFALLLLAILAMIVRYMALATLLTALLIGIMLFFIPLIPGDWFPIYTYPTLNPVQAGTMVLLIFIVLLVRHKQNLQNIINGTEPKVKKLWGRDLFK